MKQTATLIIFFFLALFAFVKLNGPIPFTVTSIATNKSDTFNVTGEGKVTVKPDVAVINAGVTAQGATVKKAQSDLNTAINRISQAVKQVGVSDKDIQTSNYTIGPTYDYRDGTQKITGYSANSNLTIKVRTIDRASNVVDAATSAGANQVGGISFDVDDKTKLQNEARQKAVDDARKKANDAARIAGFTLGKIVNYSEGFNGYAGPVPMMVKTEGMAVDRVPTQVEPGSTEISVSVTLSFKID